MQSVPDPSDSRRAGCAQQGPAGRLEGAVVRGGEELAAAPGEAHHPGVVRAEDLRAPFPGGTPPLCP